MTSRAILALAALLALTLAPAWGQSTATGTVSGLVTDPSNAVITGAAVKLVDTATSTTRDTTTNDAGRYIFVNVTPGAYEIKVTKTGFAQSVVSHLTVEIGGVATANVVLKATYQKVINRDPAGANADSVLGAVGFFF